MAGKGHPLAKSALGTKRICSGCAAKFYDLGKDPIVCPTCDTVFVIPKPAPPRGGRAYQPRSTYDPKAQTADPMGTLKEADAPGVGDEAEDREDAEDDAEVAGVEDEADGSQEAGGVPMLEELDEK
jgi:uncharacterized protein (TIGR02300 family)